MGNYDGLMASPIIIGFMISPRLAFASLNSVGEAYPGNHEERIRNQLNQTQPRIK